jgi:hypothetical protein
VCVYIYIYIHRTIFDASGFDDMEGITWLLQRYIS